VDIQHFCQLIADLEHRVQRRLRLLKDHRNAIAPYFDHFLFRQFEKVFPIQ
jgi:hypothetical protein